MAKVSAPATLLVGEPGAGKTFSLATLAKHRKLFYLFTDPGGDESLIDACQHYGVPLDNIHWRYLPPAAMGWDAIQEQADMIHRMNYEGLGLLKSGISKSEHRQLYELIGILADFKCQRTGKSFGNASTWGPECAFAFDSITGLNQICKDASVGAKPTLHQGEWGVAMVALENFIRTVVSQISCMRVFIGHTEATQDPLRGRIFTLSLLGNKLAASGVVVRQFSDVVLAYTEGGRFYWATADDRIQLKSRNLPIKDKLEPDFGAIIRKWEGRVAAAEVDAPSAPEVEEPA